MEKNKQKKEQGSFVLGPPVGLSVCVRRNATQRKGKKPITGTSPILKKSTTNQQNIQARKNTPIMNAAAHIVAAHI